MEAGKVHYPAVIKNYSSCQTIRLRFVFIQLNFLINMIFKEKEMLNMYPFDVSRHLFSTKLGLN